MVMNHKFPGLENKKIIMNGRRITSQDSVNQLILLAFEIQ